MLFGPWLRTLASSSHESVAVDSIRPSIWPGVIVGGAMTGSAAAIRAAYSGYATPGTPGRHSDRGTGVLQFLPLASTWVLKASGVPTRSGWGRMAVSQGAAALLTAATVQGLKGSVDALRPDGSNNHSFPSGHSAWSFMSATIMAKELGDQSAWYPVGAYTFATAIALERVIDQHHYPTDIVAGAGLGILATELGYFVGDLIFGERQLSAIKGRELRPNNNFSYMSLECGLSLPLGKIHASGMEIERMPALSAAIRGAWGASDHWGLAVELGLLSMPINVDVGGDRTYVKSMSSLGVALLPFYICPLSRLVSFSAEAGGGYRYNFPLNVLDDAVTTCGSTPFGRMAAGCTLRLSPHFSARASVGYEIAHYDYRLSPSGSFHIPRAASTSGVSSALLLNLSSRYEF